MELENIDLYFGAHFSKTHTKFLAYLLHITRLGHLCAHIEGGSLLPSAGEMDRELIEQARTLPDLPIVVRAENRWYLKRSFEAEQLFAKHVQRLIETTVEPIVPIDESSLNAEQKEAVRFALSHPLSLITGGPGTGKSFTAATLIRNFSGSIAVAAPTGKAASNLRKKLPACNVRTVHRLLYEKVKADLIVIDEASMIAAEQMAKLFALGMNRLVLFGDPYQLPPVESGSFFADLVGKYPFIELKSCLRTDLQEIVDLAASIKKGESVACQPLPSLAELKKLANRDSSIILSPLRKGPYGVDTLNDALFAPQAKVPIIITCNDPEMDLYNGDVGILESEEAIFNGIKIPKYLLPPYAYAYVLSVHKAQGSEYDEVHILLPEGSWQFGREMLYTAVTRAKKKVTLYASEAELKKVLEKGQQRLSGWSVPEQLLNNRA